MATVNRSNRSLETKRYRQQVDGGHKWDPQEWYPFLGDSPQGRVWPAGYEQVVVFSFDAPIQRLLLEYLERDTPDQCYVWRVPSVVRMNEEIWITPEGRSRENLPVSLWHYFHLVENLIAHPSSIGGLCRSVHLRSRFGLPGPSRSFQRVIDAHFLLSYRAITPPSVIRWHFTMI